MEYTLNLFQIGLICAMTILLTIALITILEPIIDITKDKEAIARILNVFWIASIAFLLYVVFLPSGIVPDFLKIDKEYIVLLSAIGIILSAFIASLSVMKNIENTNNIEKEKIKRELFDRRKKAIYAVGDLLYYFSFNTFHKFPEELKKLSSKEHLDKKHSSSNVFCSTTDSHINFIKNIIDSLEDVEFIFEKKEREMFEPIQELLLSYLEAIYKEKGIISDEINPIREKLYSKVIEFCNKKHESIQLI